MSGDERLDGCCARDVRFLKRYAIGSTTLVAVLALAAFAGPSGNTRFAEIDVERINVR